MELFLLKIVAVVRPLTSIEYAQGVFDAVAIMIFVIMVGVFLLNSAVLKKIKISPIDFVIIAFCIWIITIFVIYYENANIRDVIKLLITMLSYTIVKNVLKDRAQYKNLLFWIIVGFLVPLLLSVALIAAGKGIANVSYWTGITRWQGAYTGPHSLGHSMTLFLFILVLYWNISKTNGKLGIKKGSWVGPISLCVLAVLALYSLYMSQVRSAIIGLMIFATVYLYTLNKKQLVIGISILGVIGAVFLPYWLPVLLPDVVLFEQGKTDIWGLGSGRPRMWLHNIVLFTRLPIDKQIAGVGIGNKEGYTSVGTEAVVDSHSDWLDLLMQTGIVGFLLFALLQILIFRAIVKLPEKDKYLFLAIFLAINVMMLVSNSYLWRIQVSHLYYMILAFIELKRCPPIGLENKVLVEEANGKKESL